MAAAKKDRTGQVFGRWTVLQTDIVRPDDGVQYTRYLCRCECGTEAWVRSPNLTSGSSKSCGCLRDEMSAQRMRKQPGFAATNVALSVYERNAKKRGHTWGLTREQFVGLINAPCHYCGAERTLRSYRHHDELHHNGVDRVDNSQGYTPENCVPCCKTCNTAKASMSVEEFLGWARRVASYSTQNELIARSAG